MILAVRSGGGKGEADGALPGRTVCTYRPRASARLRRFRFVNVALSGWHSQITLPELDERSDPGQHPDQNRGFTDVGG